MKAEPLVVGFDVGTTAAKGGVFDREGAALALAEASYALDRPLPGWAEQDPDDWWRAVVAVLGELGRAVDLRGVAAIGVCSQVNTHVFVDRAGAPVAPAIVWQDQRCAEVAERLDASLSPADRERMWGGPFTIDSSFLLARAAWLAENRPDEWSRARWVLSPKDYVNFRLCGEVATDPISPIGLVGRDGRYVGEVLELVPGSAERMPPIRPFTHRVGGPRAADTGLSEEAAVVVATMDAWGNLYGSGVVEAGQAMEVAGTSEIIGVLSERSHATPGVISFLPIDGLSLHAGPTQAGGDALRWFAELNELTIPAALAEAGLSQPGAAGLVFLPHLAGERAPLWDAELRGVFLGIGSDDRRAELARSVLEGVAFSARHLLEACELAAGRRVSALESSGGGAQSDLWCQIKADVLGREIRRLRVTHSGVLGAALIAGAGAGLVPSLRAAAARMVHVERTFRPRREYRALYDELYAVYRGLHPALADTFSRLGRWRSEHAS